jgi:hypothetical protein
MNIPPFVVKLSLRGEVELHNTKVMTNDRSLILKMQGDSKKGPPYFSGEENKAGAFVLQFIAYFCR